MSITSTGWAVFVPSGAVSWKSFETSREAAIDRFCGAEHWPVYEQVGHQCVQIHISTKPISRTDEEIVEQTEQLARLILQEVIGTGYVVPEIIKIYAHRDPRSQKAWRVACLIQELMTATDPNDALSGIEESDP